MTETTPPDALICPRCGLAGKPGQKFCNACGTALEKPPAPPAATPKNVPPATPPAPASPGPAGSGRTGLIIGAVVIVALLVIGVFFLLPMISGPGVSGSSSAQSGSATTKASEVVHGTISTGPMTVAAQGTIPAQGGVITVTDPGSAINGLVFTAPDGAYPAGQQVTISSAPITGNTFGSNFNPATPMISISAGSEYAETPVTVKIPVSIPDDQFAMAFYYDEVNQKLEGIPTASQDSTSVTITTRHFSDIVISMISKGTLDVVKKADSGFRPGVDDWEFGNAGSELARNGHCAGQAETMMWYYTEQRQKKNAPPLFGRYDNNGREKTPAFERDNTLGYRFASILHAKTNQDNYWTNIGSMISNVSDINTLREFKYAILLTGEPQYVGIYRPGGGHALVCYEVSDNHLFIADPNYPGKERMITFNETTNAFDPYSSGANVNDINDNGAKKYPTISYVAKSAFFSWPKIASYYEDVESGRIGFHEWWPYSLVFNSVDNKGAKTQVGRIALAGNNAEVYKIDVPDDKVTFSADSGERFRAVTFVIKDSNQKQVTRWPITLKEGSNLFAIETYEEGSWVGFDWVDFVYTPKEPTSAATLQASRSLTTARQYALNDAGRSNPECKDADKAYADANCAPAGTLGMGFWNTLPFCGTPPDTCIDTSLNGGVLEEWTFYTKEETDAYGKSKIVAVRDGWLLHYDKTWGVSSKERYKDGDQVGSCYLATSGTGSSHFECTGDTA
ncbi:MAG: zinc ribbon domain-containing protein [Methanomicrobiales archaeon]|nr:zinc ribbon domain-containing protein [Methanomicrobiales archaeon]